MPGLQTTEVQEALASGVSWDDLGKLKSAARNEGYNRSKWKRELSPSVEQAPVKSFKDIIQVAEWERAINTISPQGLLLACAGGEIGDGLTEENVHQRFKEAYETNSIGGVHRAGQGGFHLEGRTMMVPVPVFDPMKQFTSLNVIHNEIMTSDLQAVTQGLENSKNSLYYREEFMEGLEQQDNGEDQSAAAQYDRLFRNCASIEFGKRLNHCDHLKKAIAESDGWSSDQVCLFPEFHLAQQNAYSLCSTGPCKVLRGFTVLARAE